MQVLLVIKYDGTAYSGWQRQEDRVTVQGEIEYALKSIFNEKIDIMGASRTDRGVHSNASIAVFDVSTPIPANKIAFILNTYLPHDIKVIYSKEVDKSFNIRLAKSIKTYSYKIYVNPIENPILRLYYHNEKLPLMINEMKKAKEFLIGEHDFRSFSSKRTNVKSFVRTIHKIDIFSEKEENIMPNQIRIEVTGNGFLYNMVRIMAGTLIEVGRGRIKKDEVKDILEKKDRKYAGFTAPPRGLTLERTIFKEIDIDTDRFK